jgi:hypothetical protein
MRFKTRVNCKFPTFFPHSKQEIFFFSHPSSSLFPSLYSLITCHSLAIRLSHSLSSLLYPRQCLPNATLRSSGLRIAAPASTTSSRATSSTMSSPHFSQLPSQPRPRPPLSTNTVHPAYLPLRSVLLEPHAPADRAAQLPTNKLCPVLVLNLRPPPLSLTSVLNRDIFNRPNGLLNHPS